ncbi:MAG: methyl-accepting chemotaxis protein [Methylobacter sp.]
MKINMPVTNVEFTLTESDCIVSKTDLKGVITYVNEDFIRISGFARKELIGVSHNVVRHPDMPTEAFEDLWKSLKSGRPWTGLVKNRCKNGDYYWVLANATPVYENNHLVGYMSVRSKPIPAQIKAADDAYRQFREGKAINLKIQDGKVVRSNLFSKINMFKNFTINSRLATVIAIMSILLLMVGGLGMFGMSKANDGLRSVYEDRTVPMNQIATIQKLLLTNRLRITASLSTSSVEEVKENTADVEQNIQEITRIWTAYMATYMTPEEKVLAEKFAEDRKHFVAEGLKPAIAALRANEFAQANKIIEEKIRPLYKPVGEGIQNLLQLQLDIAKQEFEVANLRYNNIRNISIGLISVGIVLILGLGRSMIRAIVRPLNNTIEHFGQISQGNYNNTIEIERKDEIGKVMESLKAMQTKLGFDVAEIKRISDENLRVKIALDSICTGVMIADNDRNIVYINKPVLDILGKCEADIRTQLPNFFVADLLGTNIDGFHKNPAHQAQLLSSLTNTYKATMVLGSHTMVVTANPMFNEQGQRLGTVAEWHDRTTEVAVEKDVAAIVDASVMGDLSKRLDLQGKEGFILHLSEGINQLLETSENALNEVAQVLDALSQGDLTKTITTNYQGTFGRLKDDSNTTVEKLKNIINQIKEATDNINTASKEIAAGNNDLSHRTEEQAASLQQTAASMEELTSTVQANSQNARQANRLAVNASEIAGKGVEVVSRVVTTMDGITDASHKIVEIISVIDDIAFQTNILALNAAVEAARAGEQGRGFAVVAVEVRNLAQRAATAAGEIKRLIDDSVEKISGGTKLVTQAGQTMEEIVSSITGVTTMMSEISAASIEQTSGIEQVNQAIAQMDDVTQQNAALVEQAAASAESLEEQAQNLSVTVRGFKTESSPKSSGRSPYSVPAPQTTLQAKVKTTPSPKQPKASINTDGWEEF